MGEYLSLKIGREADTPEFYQGQWALNGLSGTKKNIIIAEQIMAMINSPLSGRKRI